MINLEDLIETKQSEYVLLLTEKDAELELLKNENIHLKETVEILRSDRIRDQQMICQLQNNCSLIEARFETSNVRSRDNTFMSFETQKMRAQV
jgi:hypothetical protein